MPKWLKTLLKTAGVLACLTILLWMGAVAYVHANKKEVLEKITAQLNENINGTLTIERMEPVLLRGFPGVSVALKNVVLRDSLWQVHKHDLLQASDVYLAVDVLSLLKGAPRIKDISVEGGRVYIYTDTTGYSNTTIFRRKKDTTGRPSSLKINKVKLENVSLVFENKSKFKLFEMDIAQLVARLDYNNNGWDAKVTTNTLVRNLMFNTEKGSFVEKKRVNANLNLSYYEETQLLEIPLQTIKLDKDKVKLGGKFMMGSKPASFVLNIEAADISFKSALSMLTPKISEKLSIVDISEPLDVEASIKGKMKFRDTPLVVVKWRVVNNTLTTPAGPVTDCSFRGIFHNEVRGGKGHNDRNSGITVYDFKGSWERLPFKVDTLLVTNLTSPVLEGRFTSQFELAKLNRIIGGKSFVFNKGNANLNLHYRGGISQADTNKAYVYGAINVNKADMSYLPRDLTFTNSSATVRFKGRDVYVQNVKLQGGSTVLHMDGSLLNFLSLYYTDPRKMVLDWNIRSEEVDLINFIGFLGRRKQVAARQEEKPGNSVSRMSAQLDKVMDASTVHLNLKVGKVNYYSFAAQNLHADVSMRENIIVLNEVTVNHAGGKLAVNGDIAQGGSVNKFAVKAKVDGVDVQEFFRSFQNFGQDAIEDKNLRGSVFATADVKGSLTEKGKMVPNTLYGFVTFDLKNGMLKDFEPIQKIGKFIFRNRDLRNVSINKLANRLDIAGDKIIIPPMYIESSALNLHVDGVYALNKGTNINIDVPLRNPKKDELILDDGERMERGMKGIVVRLKAVDGDDGNVKIKLASKEDKQQRLKKGAAAESADEAP